MASGGETELSDSPKEAEDKAEESKEDKAAEETTNNKKEPAKKVAEVKGETDEGEVRKPPERKERAAKREKAKEREKEKESRKHSLERKDENVGGDEAEATKEGEAKSALEVTTDDVAAGDVIIAGETSPSEPEEGKKVRKRKAGASKEGTRRRTKSRDESKKREDEVVIKEEVPKEESKLRVWLTVCKEVTSHWKQFLSDEVLQRRKIATQRNRCVGSLMLMILYVGIGAFIFRFTEGAFETFYKCGVKRVKRDFVDGLWSDAKNLPEDEWKSKARRRLMELEGQLQTAFEAGVTTYSGRRAWSFLNSVVYCLTVVTTIGYGHIAPATNTGRAITILYAIFGIPMFLILLADFGKLFTRGIKFLWAFVRRVYYTGSCKKVRRTAPVQEVMKGVQLVYDFATFQRRPSQMMDESNDAGKSENLEPRMTTSASLGATLASPEGSASQPSLGVGTVSVNSVTPDSVKIVKTPVGGGPIHGFPVGNDPGTPALSTYEVDDEFNLPISVAIVILLGYIFIGATIYFSWEEWSFFESFYFVFISMSTIGFGDFVPQHPMYMMASIVYLVFGLALTSMCINVVQEKLSDSFRHASMKLGATIGLQVTEEEEAAMAAQKVELAEVHTAGKKQEAT